MIAFNFWKMNKTNKWPIKVLLWCLSGIPVIYGIFVGYRAFKEIAKPKSATSIYTVMRAIQAYGPELYGSFWMKALHTFFHNFVFDLVYASISFLTIGLGDIISSFSDGIIFGEVIHASHSTVGACVFVMGELLALWYSVYLGAETAFLLITKRCVEYRGLAMRFGIIGLILFVSAIIETHVVQGGLAL